MLNVSDKDIEFFKSDVQKYNEIECEIKELKNKIKPYQDKIRELTKIKQEKQTGVLSFMENNELDVCNIDTASYELKNKQTMKQVTKGDVYDKLYKYFSENLHKTGEGAEEKAKFLHNYIYVEGREKSVSKCLKAK